MKMSFTLQFGTLFCGLLICQLPMSKGSGDCPRNLPQTQTMVKFRNKCYQFVYDEKKWHEAKEFCWENGGRLVKIPDEETNNFLTSTLDSISDWTNNGLWIGLHDLVTESRFDWIGQTPEHADERMEWSNWGPGQPSSGFFSGGDCVRGVRDDDWEWKTTPCSMIGYSYKSICEYDPIVYHTKPKPSPLPSRRPSSSTERLLMLPDGGNNDLFTTGQSDTTEQAEGIEEEKINAVFVKDVGSSRILGSKSRKANFHDAQGTSSSDSQNTTVIAAVVATLIVAMVLSLAIVFIALKRRKKSARGRKTEEIPVRPLSEGCAEQYRAEYRPGAGCKTVTYRLDSEPGPSRPGNVYVDHHPGGAVAAKVPGTPHPRTGVSFPPGFAMEEKEQEEDGYMVPRTTGPPGKNAGYTPVKHSPRGYDDPLPDFPADCQCTTPTTPAPTPMEDEYEKPVDREQNTYECIDEVMEKIKDLKIQDDNSDSS